MSPTGVALLLAAVAALVPAAAAWRTGRQGLRPAVTLAGAALAAHFLVLFRLGRIGPEEGPVPWIHVLAAWAVPMLLAGYGLSAVLGREDAGEALRKRRGTFLLLGTVGVLFLLFIGHPSFLAGYRWWEGSGVVLVGTLGKAYLSYLLVGTVLVGHNLEVTYRVASGPVRERLRPTFLGLAGVLAFFTYVLTRGLLYGEVGWELLVAGTVPAAVAAAAATFGFLRGALVDAEVPVSRGVVYTSFTAFVAGIFVLCVGVLAQVAVLTGWSPGNVVTVAVAFLALAGAVALATSARLQRELRRFIDRNFYVNRHDYRAQWFRVARALDASRDVSTVVDRAARLVQEALAADEVTIGVAEPGTEVVRPRGHGAGDPAAVLGKDSPLVARLRQERRALLLQGRKEDFDYLPIFVEDREWMEATASDVIAPLLTGDELVGTVGVSRRQGDRFTFEDLDLLDNMAAHIAAVIRSAQLTEELARAREGELLAHWSSMLLHDLKNHLSPLRMIARNMREHLHDEAFLQDAVRDLGMVADNLERLVRRLGELREEPRGVSAKVDLNRLVRAAVSRLQIEHHPGLRLVWRLAPSAGAVGDEHLLLRVVENLVTNAVEAMDGSGTLTLHTGTEDDPPRVFLEVADTGPGMAEDFVRERLFRPFATTKPQGLGLGLYQCRGIVTGHGGEIEVDTAPGRGCRFRVHLPAAAAPARAASAPVSVDPRRRA